MDWREEVERIAGDKSLSDEEAKAELLRLLSDAHRQADEAREHATQFLEE